MAVLMFKEKLAINSKRVLYFEKVINNGHKSIEIHFIEGDKPIRVTYIKTEELERDFVLAIACFETA